MEERKVEFESREIKEENPSAEELKRWIALSKLPVKKFFNTSGQLYRELGVKERLESMTEEEAIELLASNGMLVKRPLLIAEGTVLVGFKEAEWMGLF